MTEALWRDLAHQDTIVAQASPAGVGALSIIRLSGPLAIAKTALLFRGKHDLKKQKSHTLHVGALYHQGKLLDQVVVALFIAPHSFTGEESVEITCHGSPYIVEQILQAFLDLGLRMARAGEFTQRAVHHGKLDMLQAEAVADLIHAEHAFAHKIALEQLKGGFSKELSLLSNRLIELAALLELELDFSDEDLIFVERPKIQQKLEAIATQLQQLRASYALGHVLKEGFPVVISGAPNAGKSTLLNALLGEEKALVSDLAGTTRDLIEAKIRLGSLQIRLIDTAGLRKTTDKLEALGIARAQEEIKKADLLLQVVDLSQVEWKQLKAWKKRKDQQQQPYLLIGNKADLVDQQTILRCKANGGIPICAHNSTQVKQLQAAIAEQIGARAATHGSSTLLVNLRHYEGVKKSLEAVENALELLKTDQDQILWIFHIKEAIHHLKEVTGEITSEDILDHIFSKFCIGK